MSIQCGIRGKSIVVHNIALRFVGVVCSIYNYDFGKIPEDAAVGRAHKQTTRSSYAADDDRSIKAFLCLLRVFSNERE